jgi:hypothetical protein
MLISIWWCVLANVALLSLFFALLTDVWEKAYRNGIRDGAFFQWKPEVKRTMIRHDKNLAFAIFRAKGDIDHAIMGQMIKPVETDGEFV